jgi:hypothetical protein
VVGVAPRTLRLAAEPGEIDAIHPLDDGPPLFHRSDLDGPVGHALLAHVRIGPTHREGPDPAQDGLLPPAP